VADRVSSQTSNSSMDQPCERQVLSRSLRDSVSVMLEAPLAGRLAAQDVLQGQHGLAQAGVALDEVEPPASVGEQSVVADADKAVRQSVQQEPADDLGLAQS
jgi:hypothetical protein